MFELILQNSFVDTIWGTITAVTIGISTVSGLVVFWVKKLRDRLQNSKNENAKKLLEIFDGYVIPLLEEGEKVAEITARQEVKAKQFGEILYDTMGEKANEIRDKYEVKLVNLTKDVTSATQGTVAYHEKLKAMEALLEEIRIDIQK